MYTDWPRNIGDIEICLLQPPARQNRFREPHYETYELMAAELVDVLAPYLDKPFGFFGHCGGALPGAEVTRQLGEAGLPLPKRVFVSSQVAPQDGPYGRLLGLEEAELRDELSKIIVALGGKAVPELVDMGLKVLSQDLEANKRYVIDEPYSLHSGITAIGWTEDAEIPLDLMGGWMEVSNDCRLELLKGGHLEFLSAPAALMDLFQRDLLQG